MGADGGLNWLSVSDEIEFFKLVGWFFWRIENSSAQAYKSDYRWDIDSPKTIKNRTWIEGAYGTDCDYSFQSLLDLLQLIKLEEQYLFMSGNEDIRDYTFEELLESVSTDSTINIWDYRSSTYYGCDTPPLFTLTFLFDSLRDELRLGKKYPNNDRICNYDFGKVPDYLRDVTLREWSRRVSELVDFNSYQSEENWT